MTPSEFVGSVGGFSKLNSTEQVRHFCWYLVVHRDCTTVTGSMLNKCFDEANCPRPSSISGFLSALVNARPPQLLKRSTGYALTAATREALNTKLAKRPSALAVDKLLQSLPAKLTVKHEQVYLEEALTCFRHAAVRAAIVMTWNLAYDHLCNVILGHHLAAFNIHLPKVFPKADILSIAVRDDFESLKESQVLQVAKSANIITGSVHKILKEKLDRRNIAAHPSGVIISPVTAEEFIVDLVQNVMLKL